MRKIAVVAITEFRSFVQTKTFLVSTFLVPVLLLGSAAASQLANDTDLRPRRFAVIDHTDVLYGAIARAALERDRADDASAHGHTPFVPAVEKPTAEERLDDLRLRLSNAIRREELFAFVEIPANALSASAGEPTVLGYHSDSPTYVELRDWLKETLAKEMRTKRYAAAGIRPEVTASLEQPLRLQELGLWSLGPDGLVRASGAIDNVHLILAPLALMMLAFVLVMTVTPLLLNAVLEEKTSRISEVLLGSVNPFELMMGKLICAVAVSLVLAALYVIGGIAAAAYFGYDALISARLLAAFALFLVLAVFLYGSIFLAFGAACHDAKEAQSLLMPVFLLMGSPLFVLRSVVEAPASPFSVAASLTPTASPFLMLLRVGLHPSPPVWQLAASVALTIATTVFCVWAAGRVFRVGLLMQGKTPSLLQLARWVVRS